MFMWEKLPCASGLTWKTRTGEEGEISCVAFAIFFLKGKNTLLATAGLAGRKAFLIFNSIFSCFSVCPVIPRALWEE